MQRLLYIILCAMAAGTMLAFVACSQDAPPEGAAVRNREKMPVMVSRGVSKIISDSGVPRYRLITEEWAVYDQTTPPRQDFLKGILILRLDAKMDVDMQISADTAYWYDQNLWELRGRVNVDNDASKVHFRSEHLYWDMQKHEFYSDVWMRVVTPDREIEGSQFKANEQMTHYEVKNDKGRIPMPTDKKAAKNDTTARNNGSKE